MTQEWVMEVLVDGKWKAVKPSGDVPPYKFASRWEAETALSKYYPDEIYGETVRAARVCDG